MSPTTEDFTDCLSRGVPGCAAHVRHRSLALTAIAALILVAVSAFVGSVLG